MLLTWISITSMEWSPENPSLLATICKAGDARVWDMRQRTSSLQHLSLTGTGKALGWNPYDSNILATCSDTEVCLWDTRQSDSVLKRFQHDGVSHFTWTAQPETIILGTSSGDSEWWDMSSTTKTHIISPNAVSATSKFLSTPHGPAVVVTRPKATGGCGVSIMSSLQQSSLKSLYFQPGPDGALSGNQAEVLRYGFSSFILPNVYIDLYKLRGHCRYELGCCWRSSVRGSSQSVAGDAHGIISYACNIPQTRVTRTILWTDVFSINAYFAPS